MKCLVSLPLVLVALFAVPALSQADEKDAQIDQPLSTRSALIFRGKRLKTASGPLHPTDEVQIVSVLKNVTNAKLGETIPVIRGEFSAPVPDDECTVYLARNKKGWALVGVSHTAADAARAKELAAEQEAEARATPAAEGWIPVFLKEPWYQQHQSKPQTFRGKLESVPQLGNASALQRTSYYKLGDRTVYTGAKKLGALEKLVGKEVEIRGKTYDINLEGQPLREIWPAAVRPAPANDNAPAKSGK